MPSEQSNMSSHLRKPIDSRYIHYTLSYIFNQIKNLCIEQYAFAAAAPQFGVDKRFIVFVSAEEKRVSSVRELQ